MNDELVSDSEKLKLLQDAVDEFIYLTENNILPPTGKNTETKIDYLHDAFFPRLALKQAVMKSKR